MNAPYSPESMGPCGESKTAERWRRHQERRERVGVRYPIGPLLSALGMPADVTAPVLARRMGMSTRWVARVLADGGLDRTDAADRWASKAGLSPALVWGSDWWDVSEPDDWYSDDPSLDELEEAA